VNGQGLPFVAPDATAYRPGQPLRPLFDNRLPEADRRAEVAIPVERIGGDVLLISGGDDKVWPATPFAERIVARLQAAGFRHRIEHLSYPAAGHLVFVGDPAGPMAGFARSASTVAMGGDAGANASAWADNWPRTLAFLQQAGEPR
jgi:pimeloyl-ACP methyl ester carboxylesterase